MSNIKRYQDYVIFTLLTLLLVWFIYWEIKNEVPMINETLALMLCSISIVFKIYRLKKPQYIILILLLILLTNVLHFSYTIEDGESSLTYHSGEFNNLSINPIILLVVIFFIMINRKIVWDMYSELRFGSEEEKRNTANKQVNFYYDKFKACEETEFDSIFGNKEAYPTEAQIALRKINEERNISTTTH